MQRKHFSRDYKEKGLIMVRTHRKTLVGAGLVFCLVSTVFAYSGGSGTETDPYQIGMVSDWNDLMNTPSDWDANFVMTTDINLQDVPLTPVGDYRIMTYFSGVFDGNGHVIRNAVITDRPDDSEIGVFGRISSDSQIRNLGVEDVNMSGNGRVGGLVGSSNGTISNCYATGKVSQSFPQHIGIGGLVGLNYGTITGSHTACQVDGTREGIGGLVGVNVGTIIDCYTDGTINGDDSVGGLVGENIVLLFDPNYMGTIARCYATASVSGRNNVGGLVGKNGDNIFLGRCSVTDCYATGSVSGDSYVGGLVGYNFISHVINCYAVGMVSGNDNVGGLIGIIGATNSFWDVETSGQESSAGGTGMATAEMKTLSTFMSAGWDFVDTWGIGENQTYPFLRTYSGADLNYDGLVNLTDFVLFADRWLIGG